MQSRQQILFDKERRLQSTHGPPRLPSHLMCMPTFPDAPTLWPELRRDCSNLLCGQLRHRFDDARFGDTGRILRDTNIPIERTADCIRSMKHSDQARLGKLQRRTWRRKIKTIEPVYRYADDDRVRIGRAPLLEIATEKTGLAAPGLFRLCADNRRQH